MSELQNVKLNLYQRLSAITDELGAVAKNLSVSTGGSNSYKAVSERDVLDAVKPIEVKYGIYSFPFNREIVDDEMLESETTFNNKTTKKTTFFTRIKTTYRFVNIDNPNEYIDTIVFSEGIDTQDKGSGKAMTYADKYALLKVYKISTGDDPDQEASQDTRYTDKNSKQMPTQHKEVTKLIDSEQIKFIQEHYQNDIEGLNMNLSKRNVSELKYLPYETADKWINWIKGLKHDN